MREFPEVIECSVVTGQSADYLLKAVVPDMEYYEAFEEAYDSDEWSVVEPFFTDDAVYEVTGAAALTGTPTGRIEGEMTAARLADEGLA